MRMSSEKDAGKRRRDARDDGGGDDDERSAAVLRRKVAAQELALQEACAAVTVKRELMEEEVHASQRREGRLREVILRQLDGAPNVPARMDVSRACARIARAF